MKSRIENMFLKKNIWFFITLGVVFLIGFLPQITAFFYDDFIGSSPQYSIMKSIRLDEEDTLSAIGKFSLLQNFTSIEISQLQAEMSEEEVKETVFKEIGKYVDAGLIPAFEEAEIYDTPLFIYNPKDTELKATIWDGHVWDKKDSTQSISFTLDEETGKIILIHYVSEQEFLREEQEARMVQFVGIFFDTWGIEGYEDLEVPMKNVYLGENTIARAYSFGDVVYGEVNVVFQVYGNGFYVEFPKKLDSAKELNSQKKE